MGDPACTYLRSLSSEMKWTDAKRKFVTCASCLKVKRASFSMIDLILLMLDLVTGDLGTAMGIQ